jgi:hypothetical protein
MPLCVLSFLGASSFHVQGAGIETKVSAIWFYWRLIRLPSMGGNLIWDRTALSAAMLELLLTRSVYPLTMPFICYCSPGQLPVLGV